MAALSLRGFSLSLLTMLCLAGVARAQAGASVKISGGVSATVALSIPQEAAPSGTRVNSSQNADRSLTVIISGATRDFTVVRIPVQIRSNTGYKLFAKEGVGGSKLSSLLVVGARLTGVLAAPGAAEEISVTATFDGRRGTDNSTPPGGLNRPGLSALSELLSGPRVSLGGTLQSPHNALEVVLSVTVEPQAGSQDWTVELLLSAEPAARF
jgi:hypothetical protein